MLISMLCLSIGCTTQQHAPSVNTISNAGQQANVKWLVDQRVETDKLLSNVLALMEIRESNTNDGFMRVQVFFKNLSTAPFSFSYRFNWYDTNGVEVEMPDENLWKKLHAVPGDDVTLTSVAPARNCADFKVRLISRF